ncbi:MAG: NAD(P)-dependent alcohol dehydrogenase [Clostridia bacterium]|jgi:L-iditol 2-dehydrogenase
MKKEMWAAVMPEVGKIRMEKREIPVPKDNEVLVRIKHVGICGSDLHYFEHGRIGSYVVENPMILGHESAGEVVETGKDVEDLRPGDLVALEPGITCGTCEFCKTGRYNLCPDVVFMATPPYDGAFVEYVAYPRDMVFKLPEGMDTLEGALIEPLAVGFHAVHQAQARIGQSAVVLGAGCIGLVTLMVLKAVGVTEIYVADLIPKRLEMAKKLGATEVFNGNETDVVKAVSKLTGGQGVDMVFETAGSRLTTQQTVELVKRGGNIVLVGMAPEGKVTYDLGQLIDKEASIHTVFRYRNLYPTAIKAVAAGLIPLKEIVTDIFPFQDIGKALAYNIHNKQDMVKAVIAF